jgi:YD repeat-containing protein
MFITEKLLKDCGACDYGIKFFRNYFPDGIDTYKIKVTGDYKDYWHFIEHLTHLKLVYDDNKNVIRTSACGDVHIYKYDTNGNLVSEEDSDGRIWKYKCDNSGNIIEKIHPDGDVHIYKYDTNGNKIEETDSDGNIWNFKYDTNNNMIEEADSNGRVWKYKYDCYGNIVEAKYPDGEIWESPYNFTIGEDGRLTKITENDRVICKIEYLD